jgi:hypothetical protein
MMQEISSMQGGLNCAWKPALLHDKGLL